MGMDATAVFSHIPENRFDAYLNYFIPQAIAEKDGILRPAAVDWAVTEQNRLDGRLKATQTVGSSEEVKGRIAKLLGRSGAPAGIPQKENPMASRLLNNARYLQLAQKTGRVMGRKFLHDICEKVDDLGPEHWVVRDSLALIDKIRIRMRVSSVSGRIRSACAGHEVSNVTSEKLSGLEPLQP
jgi:hypothetical protein